MNFGYQLACRYVLVFQIARYAEGCEEKVVRKEFHVGHFHMLFQTMQFDTVSVVDINILLLCDCEELIVVEPSYVWNS